MTKTIVVQLVRRMTLLLMLAWLFDLSVVQNLPDKYFDAGKSTEIILTLALAWRYCMPLAQWQPRLNPRRRS